MSLCEFGVVTSQKKSLYVSVSFMGAMAPHFFSQGSGPCDFMVTFGVHDELWRTIPWANNPHGGKCLFINKTVETFASFGQDTRSCAGNRFRQVFFNGNFKHQNNSCVHKGHKGHKQSKQSMDSQVEPKFWALPTEAPVRLGADQLRVTGFRCSPRKIMLLAF